MKIAIHKRTGSFSDRWIEYCEEHQINYKIVNCYDTDIIAQLKDCDGLMWHWSHTDYRAQNFARQLIMSVEKMGIKVFPDINTCWHFDDKVGQKYLLEAINVPLVPSYVFYNKKDAVEWIKTTDYPKVFKLRGGAGSQNVKLVKTKKQALKLTKKAFSKGFSLVSSTSNISERLRILKMKPGFKTLLYFIKGVVRIFFPRDNYFLLTKQKGYIYFQDFIKYNKYDERIVIIGNRAISFRRYNRKNDFRASGSKSFDHNPEIIPRETIKKVFEISHKLKTDSLAFDMIYDKNKNPLIVEISYAFTMKGETNNCPGYWDRNLNWVNDKVNPQRYMIEDFIKNMKFYKK